MSSKSARARAERATVELPIKRGRGVLIPGGLILTAAHCVEWNTSGSMANGTDCFEQVRTADGRKLLCQVVAVEPVNDIAVLGSPDNQRIPDEAESFEQFTSDTDPVPLCAGGPVPFGPPMSVLVFSLDRKWVRAKMRIFREDQSRAGATAEAGIHSGASGGPVITRNGSLVGVISTAGGVVSEEPCEVTLVRPLFALPVSVVNRINRTEQVTVPGESLTAALERLGPLPVGQADWLLGRERVPGELASPKPTRRKRRR